MALLVSLECRRKFLVPAMKKFIFDDSEWVIITALRVSLVTISSKGNLLTHIFSFQSLGQFIAAFAQPQIYGLAYDYCLDLFITNAADENFRNPGQQHQQLLYGNQPNAAVILHNLEQYERKLEESIPPLAQSYIDALKSVDEEANVEKILYNFIYMSFKVDDINDIKDPFADPFLSVGSDGNGMDVYKRYDTRKMYASQPPSYGEKPRAPASITQDDVLGKFMKLCSPLKNNFVDGPMMEYSPLTRSFQGDDMDMHPRLSRSNVGYDWDIPESGMRNRMSFGNSYDLSNRSQMSSSNSNSNNQRSEENALDEVQLQPPPPPPLPLEDSFMGGEEDSSSAKVEDSTNNNSQDTLATPEPDNTLNNNAQAKVSTRSLEDGLPPSVVDNNNDNVFLDDDAANLPPPPPIPGSVTTEMTTKNEHQHETGDPDSELDEFNSHRYWYIPPPEVVPDLNLVNSNTHSLSSLPSSSSGNKNGTEEIVFQNKEEGLSELKRSPSTESTILIASDIDETLDNTGLSNTGSETKRKQRHSSMDFYNPDLLETEWSLVEDYIHFSSIDTEMMYQCAYCFPAVIFTLGKSFWPLLQSHFLELCYSLEASVRKTIAAAIGKIALLIGREYTTRDLVAPYLEFYVETDVIQIEAVKAMPTFIKVVDPSEHDRILNQLEVCCNGWSSSHWRVMEIVGQQVIQLVKIHEQINKEHCLLYLMGIAMKLMRKKYDCVRKVGVDAFVEAFRYTKNPTQQQNVLKFLRDHFAQYDDWKQRQLYILAVDKLVSYRDFC